MSVLKTIYGVAGMILLVGSLAFGQNMDSREGDSLALVAIRKANPDSYLNTAAINMWTSGAPIDRWKGVEIKDGRVCSLTLTNGLLTIIPTEIGNLKHLITLGLDKNDIKSLPDLSFNTELQTISVCYNNVITFLPDLSKNLKLRGVSMEGSRNFSRLPDLSKNPSLSWLNISDNRTFDALPSWLVHCTNLKSLDLSYSPISVLPENIGNLRNLTFIGLEHTKITRFPDSFMNLTGLIRITFPDVFEIPDTICGFPGLKTVNNGLVVLDLAGYSNIEKLPDSIYKLTEVSEIFIDDTKIKKLPASITAMPSLSYFYGDRSQLEELPEGFFDIGGGLSKVHLSGCKLTAIPSPKTTIYMEQLDLRGNNLTTLPDGISKIIIKRELFIGGNNLYEKNLSKEAIEWLDKYDSKWRTTQKVPSPISNTSISKTVPLTATISGRTLTLSQAVPAGSSVNLYDLSGRKIVSGEIVGSSFAVPNLAKGVYVAKILAGKRSVVQKISVR